MQYVNAEDFAAYSGAASKIASDHYYDIEDILTDVETRMLYYIIPNKPDNSEKILGFQKAVYAQTVYEQEATNSQIAAMPSGMRSFTVNGFSASFDDGMADGMSNIGLCRLARSHLAIAGLLYRGVACPC